MKRSPLGVLIAGLILFATAACGGGGGQEGSAPEPQLPTCDELTTLVEPLTNGLHRIKAFDETYSTSCLWSTDPDAGMTTGSELDLNIMVEQVATGSKEVTEAICDESRVMPSSFDDIGGCVVREIDHLDGFYVELPGHKILVNYSCEFSSACELPEVPVGNGDVIAVVEQIVNTFHLN